MERRESSQYFGYFFAGFALILLAFRTFSYFSNSYILFSFDDSFDFGITRFLLDGNELLLGSPTHVGGRHLGPLFYWYLALNFLLAGGSEYYVYVLYAVECFAAGICTAILTTKFFPEKNRWYAAAATLLTFCGPLYILQFREPWQGNFVFLGSVGVLYTFYLCIECGKRYFFWFCTAASFLIISHYACAPLVAGTGSIVLLRLFQKDSHPKTEDSSGFLRFVVIPLLANLVLWLPCLLYELQYKSNLHKLAADFLKQRHRTAGIGEAIKTCANFFHQHLFTNHEIINIVDLRFIVRDPASLGAILLGALLIIFFRDSTSKNRYFLGGLLLSIGIYIVLTAGSPPARRFEPAIYEYYFNGMLPIPALFVGIAFGHSITLLERSIFQKAAALTFILYSFISLCTFAIRTDGVKPAKFSSTFYHTIGNAQCIAKAISKDLKKDEHAYLFTSVESEKMRNSYLYFLGPDYFGDMNVFDKKSVTANKYMSELYYPSNYRKLVYYSVVCPDRSDQLRMTYSSLDNQELKIVDDLRIENVRSCRYCRISRLGPR